MEPVPVYAVCPACGTSPVNHQIAYVTGLVDDIFSRGIGYFFDGTPLPENALTRLVDKFLFTTLAGLRIVRFNTDPEKASTERSRLIWDEAIRREIPMEQIVFFGSYLDHYRAYIQGEWIYFQSLPIPYWMRQAGYHWADDKFALKQRLEKANIAVPKTRRVRTWEDTVRAFGELTTPVIIKPKIGSRGRHTTTYISTLEELRRAYDVGREIAHELVIEEHLFGGVSRATVVGGKLVGYFCAHPPCVTGDGVRSVAELIEDKNASRPDRVQAIQVTEEMRALIGRQGFTLESVLSEGNTLNLLARTGRFFGGYTKEMLAEIHPRLHEILEEAGRVAEIPVAGFDVIIPDPTNDPDTQKWGIIECNSLPFIDLHYFALEGPRNDVSKHVWDLWEKKA